MDGLRELCAKATSVAQGVSAKGGKAIKGKSDPSTLGIVFMAFLCAVLPLDISQLSFAMVGAILYAILHKSDPATSKKPRISVVVEAAAPHNAREYASACNPKPKGYSPHPTNSFGIHLKSASGPTVSPEVRALSVQPILAPTFQSKGWEGEIQELLLQITPTSEGDQIVKELARRMQNTLKGLVPEVEVTGLASGNIASGKAFGVAVPEVHMIVSVNPQILSARLHGRSGQSNGSQLDAKKLQKCALRTFTDRLVAAGGFKFRRSAFRGNEPKVTLLAPASLGLFSEAIPIDFSVNVMTPLYNAALLTECGKMDSRAKELILIVKRWAKDRGICHEAKGHLSPYLWGLLTIYFLQVRDTDDEGPLLPPLARFETSATFLTKEGTTPGSSRQPKWKSAKATGPKASAGTLFKEFVHFYESTFGWDSEAVSIRAGQRAPPSLEVPLHIIVADDSTVSQVGPSIEDPLCATQNLGDGMNSVSLARLKEELSRAKVLCDSCASLSELLDPWVPADQEARVLLSQSSENGEPKNGDEHGSSCDAPSLVTRKGKDASKPLPSVVAASNDWRHDAAKAQASAPTRRIPTSTQRRPGTVSYAANSAA